MQHFDETLQFSMKNKCYSEHTHKHHWIDLKKLLLQATAIVRLFQDTNVRQMSYLLMTEYIVFAVAIPFKNTYVPRTPK